MGWFSKSKRIRPSVKTSIGTFTFFDEGCVTTLRDEIEVYSSGIELDVATVARAAEVINEIDRYVLLAIDYARSPDSDIWDGRSKLTLVAIAITDILDEQFSLMFSVESEVEHTVNVEFNRGKPVEVWGGD